MYIIRVVLKILAQHRVRVQVIHWPAIWTRDIWLMYYLYPHNHISIKRDVTRFVRVVQLLHQWCLSCRNGPGEYGRGALREFL
jgi:hypothetical protein